MLGPDDVTRLLDALAAGDRSRLHAVVDAAAHLGEDDRARLRQALDEAAGSLEATRARAARLAGDLERAQTELLVARNDLLEAWAQIRAMRSTASWRATAPLRLLGRLARRR